MSRSRPSGRVGVVVLRSLGLGDLLTGVPALRAVAEAFSGERRVVVVTPGVAPLAEWLGVGDVAIGWPPIGAGVAVNLHGKGPQSHEVLLATRPGRLIAFANAEAGVDGPEWRAGEHEVRRWCRMLSESGIPADPANLEVEPPPNRFPTRGCTVVHPGAASAARRWPPSRWASVAAAEVASGRQVVITGSASERALALEVAERAGLDSSCVLAGRTSVMELAGVVAEAGRVLSGDTGVGHLATAFCVPSVLLFGPVPPSEWGPPADRPWHRALWAGRRGDPHAGDIDPGLLEITVDDVLAAMPA